MERTKSIVLLLVQLFSVVQTGLSIAGISQLPFTSDQVSTAITGVIAVIASVYAWWRNNNVTSAAVQGQQVVNAVKLAQSTGNAVDMPGEVVPMSEMISTRTPRPPRSDYIVQIKEEIVNAGHGYLNPSLFAVHSTANPGATARNHRDLWSRGYDYAVHLTSDWTEAIHCVPYDRLCWQVGNATARARASRSARPPTRRTSGAASTSQPT